MKNNHINQTGDLHMIDISSKDVTTRIARARGSIILNNDAFESVVSMNNKKGDVLNTARISGINAVKQTANLIPLAHVIPINSVTIDFDIIESEKKINCFVSVKSDGKTGVEIESLIGVEIALMTIYDMCKYLDRGMKITDIKLLSKTGGKSGDYQAKDYD
jgi:cyclic pyranopterin phosphate synthase